MKLEQLKQVTFQTWEFLNWQRDVTADFGDLLREVSQYGDLESKETWERAFVAIEATSLYYPALDGHQLIQLVFTHPHEPELIEYNDQILKQFLQFPSSLDRLEIGLEQLYYQPTSPGDRQDALTFLKRLAEVEEIKMEFPSSVSMLETAATSVDMAA
jgi:hypothetical protein